MRALEGCGVWDPYQVRDDNIVGVIRRVKNLVKLKDILDYWTGSGIIWIEEIKIFTLKNFSRKDVTKPLVLRPNYYRRSPRIQVRQGSIRTTRPDGS